MDLDYEKIGVALAGAGGITASVWAWILSQRKNLAATRAEVSIADSQQTVFAMLQQRQMEMQAEITSLRSDVDKLRDIVRTRDNKIHSLEIHILDLEHTLIAANISIPVYKV